MCLSSQSDRCRTNPSSQLITTIFREWKIAANILISSDRSVAELLPNFEEEEEGGICGAGELVAIPKAAKLALSLARAGTIFQQPEPPERKVMYPSLTCLRVSVHMCLCVWRGVKNRKLAGRAREGEEKK